MRDWLQPFKLSIKAFLALTVLTGFIYPALVAGFGQVLFPAQANGSLIQVDGRVVGSALIGQPFQAPGYFWSRPSATTPMPYNAAASAGSNLAPSNPALIAAIKARVAALQFADPEHRAKVPVDLVTASASGLDPDISPAAAEFQVPRVARARGLSPTQVEALVAAATTGPQWGVFGEPRVNVLKLNLALDALTQPRARQP
ncbi:MAG: potassium-transporting ATPase subunit KdpC [Planctomycetota bacterium]